MSKNNNLSVDEQVVRLIAFEVVIITIISLVTKWSFPIIFLITDFALRAFTNVFSPLAIVAKRIAIVLKLKSKPIFAPPKKFAAAIGFVFSLIILILFLFQQYFLANIIGAVLIFCAVLESVFKICVGCYVYDWFVAPWVNKRNSKIS